MLRLAAARRLLTALVAITLVTSVLPPGAADAAPRADIDAHLIADLRASGTATFLVTLKERAALTAATRLPDGDRRAARVRQELTGTAERSQRGVRSLLDRRRATYTPFWITNGIQVTGDRSLVDELALRGDVLRIESAASIALEAPTTRPAPASVAAPVRATATQTEAPPPTWGLTAMGVPEVWDEFVTHGEGIVVANIDTGVAYDHPALIGRYRGNTGGVIDHAYNFFDPSGVCQAGVPCDDAGHGTHTMGTMVGAADDAAFTFGVAPGATWIAAKGCSDANCPFDDVAAAGQWILAPTDADGLNPRPDLRPDIVNNSWGMSSHGAGWYRDIVRAWVAAGIFPIFGAGNAGPDCGTAGSPGDYPEAYQVTSYDRDLHSVPTASRGATAGGDPRKPDIAAPGEEVYSSSSVRPYESLSGTSMAAPHVAGAVALLWSATPNLKNDVAATRALLDRTAIDSDDTSCGGTPADNAVFGEGRIDVHAAIAASPHIAVGTVAGRVTHPAGGPVEGASVSSGDRSGVTGADGRFAVHLLAGPTRITVRARGLSSRTVEVVVPDGATVVADVALDAAPRVSLHGVVRDGSGLGTPIGATVEVVGSGAEAVQSDPVTGAYTLEVPGNTVYRMLLTAPGYLPTEVSVSVGDGDTAFDPAVSVDATACTAVGYTPVYEQVKLSEGFDSTTTPTGWTVTPGWRFDDPRTRGNTTGGTGGFAIADNQAGIVSQAKLNAPAISVAGLTNPYVRFRSDVTHAGNAQYHLMVTTAASTVDNEWRFVHSVRDKGVWHDWVEAPLTGLGDPSNVRLRFLTNGSLTSVWQVDDVLVGDRRCGPA
jgi:subtilisin family serine protease